MDKDTEQVFDDIKNDFYPADDNAFEKIKCDLKPGKIVHWYYKDDLEFASDAEFDIHDEPGYSGIIVPINGVTIAYGENTDLEAEHCIIVIIEYPCEKEYCISGWIYLNRLLDNKDLVEIF
jgi:hypothetical protein